jgi:hypothetical protein
LCCAGQQEASPHAPSCRHPWRPEKHMPPGTPLRARLGPVARPLCGIKYFAQPLLCPLVFLAWSVLKVCLLCSAVNALDQQLGGVSPCCALALIKPVPYLNM